MANSVLYTSCLSGRNDINLPKTPICTHYQHKIGGLDDDVRMKMTTTNTDSDVSKIIDCPNSIKSVSPVSSATGLYGIQFCAQEVFSSPTRKRSKKVRFENIFIYTFFPTNLIFFNILYHRFQSHVMVVKINSVPRNLWYNDFDYKMFHENEKMRSIQSRSCEIPPEEKTCIVSWNVYKPTLKSTCEYNSTVKQKSRV